jgi:hypothetical protein
MSKCPTRHDHRYAEDIIAHQRNRRSSSRVTNRATKDRRDARLLHGLRQAAQSRSNAEETVLAVVSSDGGVSMAITDSVTTPKFPERSGPAVRAVLAELARNDLVEFEAEFRIALAEADEDFDLARVQAVIDKWWGCAYLRMYPPTEEERAVVARCAAGDDAGLYTKTVDGQWVRH